MYIFLIFLTAVLIFIDQITKHLMYIYSDQVIGFSYPIIEDFFNLTYVENHGGIFGIFQGNIKIFTLVSSILILYIVYTEWENFINTKYINKLGIIFIISGAAGNMIDRYFRGYVIDMIDFRGIWSYIFNFADIYIHIGIYILLIAYLFDKRRKK